MGTESDGCCLAVTCNGRLLSDAVGMRTVGLVAETIKVGSVDITTIRHVVVKNALYITIVVITQSVTGGDMLAEDKQCTAS